MSMNDKVKIVWKTSCQWKNRPHWPKRKDIKLPEGETQTPVPLKPGDAVKVKEARNSFHFLQTSFTNSFPNTVWFIVSV